MAENEVHRLTDMSIDEVSLVDRAANKHRFLLVKRAVDDGVSGYFHTLFGHLADKVDLVKACVEAADATLTNTGLPPFVFDQLRTGYFIAKSIVTNSPFPSSTICIDKSDEGNYEIGPERAGILKLLSEIQRRMEPLEKSLEGVTALDSSQEDQVRGVVDLISKVLKDYAPSVAKESFVRADQVDPDVVAKGLESLLNAYLGVLIGAEGTTDLEKVFKISDQPEQENHQNGNVAVESGNEIEEDQDNQPEEVVVADTQKSEETPVTAEEVQPAVETEKAEKDQDILEESSVEPEVGLKEEVEAEKSDEPQPETQEKAEHCEDKTEKAGAPMQQDRLYRLREAMKLINTAAKSIKSGDPDMNSFTKGVGLLRKLYKELHSKGVKKAAMRERGMTDTRGLTPDRPNAGAGVQPDTATIAGPEAVFGEGVQHLTDVAKSEKNREQDLAQKEKEIENLRGELTRLRKYRRAAAAVPLWDGSKAEEENVIWPMDMAARKSQGA